MKKQICPKCGKKFRVGYDGILRNGEDICDTCAGVGRDEKGDILWPPSVGVGEENQEETK